MLGTLRRRLAAGVVAAGLAGSMLFVTATSADANPVVLGPLVIEAGADVGAAVAGGCAATGPGCAVVGAAALAYGAWWAWSNRDQILNWVDNTLGTPVQSSGVPGGGGVWVVSYPDPAAGPYTRVSGESFFVATCQSAACYGGFTAKTKCLATDGSVVTYTFVDSDYMVNPGIQSGTIGSGVCVSPSKVVEQSLSYGSSGGYEFWHASGGWDATRTTTTTVTCKTPGGSSSTVTSTVTGTVTGTARTATVPGCPSGTYATKVEVKDGTGGIADYPRIDWQAKPDIETTYPNCFTGTTPGPGGCLLNVAYQGTTCTDAMAACTDWYDNSAFGAAGYTCLWGPYTVPISSCDPMRYAYVPGSTLDPTTGLPTNPNATPTPNPSSSSSGGTFPTTGPNPLPSPSASASGWVQPNPFPQPTGTATPVPEPPPVVGPNPGDTNCLAAAWSWNPVNWVVVPVECALTWAFVPDSTALDQLTQANSDAWNNSKIGTFTTAATNAFGPLVNIGSNVSDACGGVTYNFPVLGAGHPTTDIHLLDACNPPMSNLAPIVKGILSVVVLAYGVWGIVRLVGAGLGWNIGRLPEWEQQTLDGM